jgi:hypothetical protein
MMNLKNHPSRVQVTALTALYLCALALPARGQLGLRGGVNLSKFVGADAAGSEAIRRLSLGASIPLIHIGPFSVVPELYYSQKGARQLNPLAPGQPFSFGLDYIEVPVLAKVSFPLKGLLRGYVGGGPAYAWRIDCSISVSDTTVTNTFNNCSETFGSFKTAMQKADRGVVVNGGLDFKVPGLGGLNLDARLIHGLSRLTPGTTGGDIKNQAVSLMLGYYLGAPR